MNAGTSSRAEPLFARILLAAGAGLFLLACLKPLRSPDLFWHLSVGERMLSTGVLARTELLSHTRAGAPWVDFEWLSQLVYAGLFRLGGFHALLVLKVLVFVGAALCLDAHHRRRGAGRAARGALLAALAAGWSVSLDLRPDAFTLLFLCAELALLEAGVPRASPRACLTALLAAALWANLHGGFVYGLALLAAYLLRELLGARRASAAVLGGLLLCAFLGTLLNPWGLGIYAPIAEHARLGAELQRIILEWAPASPRNPFEWPFFLCLAATFAALVAYWVRERSPAPLPTLLLAGTALAGLRHMRNEPYLVMTACAFVPGLLPARLLRPTAERLAAAGTLLIALAYLAALERPLFSSRAWNEDWFPVRTADVLRADAPVLSGLRLYNPWGWGGYLGFRLAPEYRVFTDGRYLFHALLQDEKRSTTDPAAWADFLRRHRLELVLLKRDMPDVAAARRAEDGTLVREPRPYYLFFMPQEDWALIYWDRHALLFARRTAVPPAWLKERAYAYLHPGDVTATIRAARAGRLPRARFIDEACRHVRESGADPELPILLREGFGLEVADAGLPERVCGKAFPAPAVRRG